VSKLRIAVIGAGNLGKIHARLLSQQKNVNLVAVADPSPAAQQQILEQLDTTTVSDYQKLFDQVDAVVIATPTRMHHKIAVDFLEHGIHTLIEKPLSDSVSDAHELVSLAERSQCVVSVGHVEQFNPAFQAAIEKVGQPKFIQANRMSGYTFRSTDIGVVHDLMIHDIDLVNSVFAGKLIETRAIGFSMFGGHEDMTQARLQFSCGAVANLTASRCSFEPQRNMQIFGTDGFAAIDFVESKVTVVSVPSWMKNRELDFFQLTSQQMDFVRENLFSDVLPKQELMIERENAIMQEQKDFIAAIKDGRSPHVSVAQGAEAVSIAETVLDSVASHRWEQRDAQMTGPLPGIKPVKAVDAIPTILSQSSAARRAA
jgi:predicted dehydrogenase